MPDIETLKERARYRNLLREYEAICFILNKFTQEDRAALANSYADQNRLKKGDLRKRISMLKVDISELRQEFAIKASPHALERILKSWEEVPDKDWLIPKFLLNDVFDGRKLLTDFERLPAHAYIAFHGGAYRTVVGEVEIHLVEACLFEDMCALFNAAKMAEPKMLTKHSQGQSKICRKTAVALFRATITAVFNLMEAYLNGLAYDYCVQNKHTLDDATKRMLTEWDYARKRPYYLSLRDKVLQYPKIILGHTHPPIQENNTPEFRFLIDYKDKRNAIVHPSPGPDLETYENLNSDQFFNLDQTQVERVVDCAITLIRKIEKTITGNTDSLFWLHLRGTDGLFPEKAFD